MSSFFRKSVAFVAVCAVMLTGCGCGQEAQLITTQTTIDISPVDEVDTSELSAVASDLDETAESSDENEESEGQSVLVSFIGDLTLTQDVNANSTLSFDSVVGDDMDYCFQNCKDIFLSDDMTLANLENAVTTLEEHAEKEFVFAMKPENLEMLTRAGIDAVNLANNHTRDYLQEGLEETRANLESYGIVWSDQYFTATYEVDGVVIGMLGLSNTGLVDEACTLVDELKAEGADIIIASCHWGNEATYEPTNDQVYCGHALIDYGVDIVVGTHPHRLQPIEKYNGHYIIYSLSNFCFGGNTTLSDPDSAIIQCEFVMDKSGSYCVDYRLTVLPYSQTSTRPGNDYCPVAYDWGSSDYYRCLRRLEWSSEDE